ncbi:hypothetical protein JXI42_13295 [bacterium]|nr:hypothetical protein [bacterium]
MKIFKALVITIFVLVGLVSVAYSQFGSYYIHTMGTGEITEGKGAVKPEGLPEEYKVILTPLGECGQLYIAEKSNEGFVVGENYTGDKGSTVQFDYFIVVERAHRSTMDNTKLEEMRQKFEEMNSEKQELMQQKMEKLKQDSNDSEQESETGETGTPTGN